jgi:hypothetical protein
MWLSTLIKKNPRVLDQDKRKGDLVTDVEMGNYFRLSFEVSLHLCTLCTQDKLRNHFPLLS